MVLAVVLKDLKGFKCFKTNCCFLSRETLKFVQSMLKIHAVRLSAMIRYSLIIITKLLQLSVSKVMIFFWLLLLKFNFDLQYSNKILSRQIHNVRVVQSLDLESPALGMAQSIRVVLFIFILTRNPPYSELLLRFTFSTYF